MEAKPKQKSGKNDDRSTSIDLPWQAPSICALLAAPIPAAPYVSDSPNLAWWLYHIKSIPAV